MKLTIQRSPEFVRQESIRTGTNAHVDVEVDIDIATLPEEARTALYDAFGVFPDRITSLGVRPEGVLSNEYGRTYFTLDISADDFGASPDHLSAFAEWLVATLREFVPLAASRRSDWDAAERQRQHDIAERAEKERLQRLVERNRREEKARQAADLQQRKDTAKSEFLRNWVAEFGGAALQKRHARHLVTEDQLLDLVRDWVFVRLGIADLPRYARLRAVDIPRADDDYSDATNYRTIEPSEDTPLPVPDEVLDVLELVESALVNCALSSEAKLRLHCAYGGEEWPEIRRWGILVTVHLAQDGDGSPLFSVSREYGVPGVEDWIVETSEAVVSFGTAGVSDHDK